MRTYTHKKIAVTFIILLCSTTFLYPSFLEAAQHSYTDKEKKLSHALLQSCDSLCIQSSTLFPLVRLVLEYYLDAQELVLVKTVSGHLHVPQKIIDRGAMPVYVHRHVKDDLGDTEVCKEIVGGDHALFTAADIKKLASFLDDDKQQGPLKLYSICERYSVEASKYDRYVQSLVCQRSLDAIARIQELMQPSVFAWLERRARYMYQWLN